MPKRLEPLEFSEDLYRGTFPAVIVIIFSKESNNKLRSIQEKLKPGYPDAESSFQSLGPHVDAVSLITIPRGESELGFAAYHPLLTSNLLLEGYYHYHASQKFGKSFWFTRTSPARLHFRQVFVEGLLRDLGQRISQFFRDSSELRYLKIPAALTDVEWLSSDEIGRPDNAAHEANSCEGGYAMPSPWNSFEKRAKKDLLEFGTLIVPPTLAAVTVEPLIALVDCVVGNYGIDPYYQPRKPHISLFVRSVRRNQQDNNAGSESFEKDVRTADSSCNQTSAIVPAAASPAINIGLRREREAVVNLKASAVLVKLGNCSIKIPLSKDAENVARCWTLSRVLQAQSQSVPALYESETTSDGSDSNEIMSSNDN